MAGICSIVSGHPLTTNKDWDGRVFVDDALIVELPSEHAMLAFAWVQRFVRPIKSPNYKHSSYGLKHVLEHDTGVYLTNNQFKDLMLAHGYEPVDVNTLNWTFRISERALNKTLHVERPRGWMRNEIIGDK